MALQEEITKFRREIPLTRLGVFMNHAETSPMLRSVTQCMSSYLRENFQALDTSRFIEQGCPRSLIAKLIGGTSTEICYTPNTSYGINVAANSFPFKRGTNIVLWELEFPGNLYPWLNQRSKGIQIRWCHGPRLDVSKLEKLIDDRTVAVAVSHVNWINGFRPDLKRISEIVHKHGGLLFVDAAQSAGAISIRVKQMGIDALACAFYKWLLGPSGAGFLYVREDLIKKLASPFVGFNGVKNTGPPFCSFNPKAIDLQDGAKRYAPGSMSPIPFLGAGLSLKMLLNVGINTIERRILYLTDVIIEGLDSLGFDVISPREKRARGGIVTFNVEDAAGISQMLLKKRIWVSPRRQKNIGGIRVSPHFYNTEAEIYKFLATLREIAKGR